MTDHTLDVEGAIAHELFGYMAKEELVTKEFHESYMLETRIWRRFLATLRDIIARYPRPCPECAKLKAECQKLKQTITKYDLECKKLKEGHHFLSPNLWLSYLSAKEEIERLKTENEELKAMIDGHKKLLDIAQKKIARQAKE